MNWELTERVLSWMKRKQDAGRREVAAPCDPPLASVRRPAPASARGPSTADGRGPPPSLVRVLGCNAVARDAAPYGDSG